MPYHHNLSTGNLLFPFISITMFTGSDGSSEVIKVKFIISIVNNKNRISHKVRDSPEIVFQMF